MGAYFACNALLTHKDAPRLLAYTDSRGFRVDHWYARKNPLGSYVPLLTSHFRVDYKVCPYPHTTLIDFLYDLRRMNHRSYDVIILHVGVVDFSPRPHSQARRILKERSARIAALFGSKAVSRFVPKLYNVQYAGEDTASLYGEDVLDEYILPAMNSVKARIVWISVNPVLPDWSGSYERGRPANMNEILSYEERIAATFLGDRVSLVDWGEKEIRELTVDNIHLSERGVRYVERRLANVLQL